MKIDHLEIAQKKSTLKIVYTDAYNQCPPEIKELFQIYCPARNLRSEAQHLILPPCTHMKLGENDIAIRGCRYWNGIPIKIKAIETLGKFKTHLEGYGKIT